MTSEETKPEIKEAVDAPEGKSDNTKPNNDANQGSKESDKIDGDEEAILHSVAERLEFFFSDANVRQDYFMRKQVLIHDDNKDDEKAGCVPIESLLRFNTIKKITTEPDVIAKAVSTCMKDTLMLKDDGKAVARVKPFTRELFDENIPLSLYVKNIPTKQVDLGKRTVTNYAVSMDDMRNLFSTYGEIALVKLRFKRSEESDDENHTDDIKTDEKGGTNTPRRKFPLGACLVEFKVLESLQKAAADVLTMKGGESIEPKRKIELEGKQLEIMMLEEYLDNLKSEKKRSRNDTENEGDSSNSKKEDEFTLDWKPGCVISLKDLPDDCDREAILDAVMKACEMTKDETKEKKVYADYSRGQKDGAIRFPDPGVAKKMFEKLNSGEVTIAEKKMDSAVLLEGEEEKKYWDDFIEFKKRQRKHRAEENRHKHRGNSKRRRRS